MAKDYLIKAPQETEDIDIWYYEQKDGIDVVHQDSVTDRCYHSLIPWEMLEASVKRYKKTQREKLSQSKTHRKRTGTKLYPLGYR